MPTISILIPHKHQALNDAALDIALSCIVRNTSVDYELLVDSTTPANPYAVINSLAARAKSDWLFFGNSDLFVAPGWDTALLDKAARNTMVTPVLVEPYMIGVHEQNITANFGTRPDNYRRADFEAYAATKPAYPDGMGFYFYCLIAKRDFLGAGAFPMEKPFPHPADIDLWTQWLADGKRIVRAGAYMFHLQNYSNPDEQQKAARFA